MDTKKGSRKFVRHLSVWVWMAMFAEHVLSVEPFEIADLRCKRMLEPHQLVTTTTFTSNRHTHSHTHARARACVYCHNEKIPKKEQEFEDGEKYNQKKKKKTFYMWIVNTNTTYAAYAPSIAYIAISIYHPYLSSFAFWRIQFGWLNFWRCCFWSI